MDRKQQMNLLPKALFFLELFFSILCGVTFVGPILGLVLGLNELLRIFIKIVLRIVYNDHIELSDDANGSNYFLVESRNRRTILYLGEVEGESPLDVASVRENYRKYVLANPVYSRKLTRMLTRKWGFVCLEKCKNFDIANHIRYYPGTEERVVTEKEVLQKILPELSEDMPSDKPQWEELIIPRYVENSSDKPEMDVNYKKVKSLKLIRMHHSYMDGASMLLMIANCFSDEKQFPYVIDPCKPLKISRISQFFYKLMSLALFSSKLLRLLLFPPSLRSRWSRFNASSTANTKILFGWTNKISIENFRTIKDKSGVSMSAIVSTVLAGAIRKFEINYPAHIHHRQNVLQSLFAGNNNKKECLFPERHPLWIVAGMFPYQADKPENNHVGVETCIDTSDVTDCERLDIMNDILGKLATNPTVTIFFWFATLIGRTPNAVAKFFLKWGSCPILLSNIPLCTRNVKLWGRECTEILGFVPLLAKCGLGIVSVRYGNHVRYCIQADSALMSQEELDYFTNQLEQEIKILINETSKLTRKISTRSSLFEQGKKRTMDNKTIISNSTSKNLKRLEHNDFDCIESVEFQNNSRSHNYNNNNDAIRRNARDAHRNADNTSAVNDPNYSFVLKVQDRIENIKDTINKIKEQ